MSLRKNINSLLLSALSILVSIYFSELFLVLLTKSGKRIDISNLSLGWDQKEMEKLFYQNEHYINELKPIK